MVPPMALQGGALAALLQAPVKSQGTESQKTEGKAGGVLCSCGVPWAQALAFAPLTCAPHPPSLPRSCSALHSTHWKKRACLAWLQLSRLCWRGPALPPWDPGRDPPNPWTQMQLLGAKDLLTLFAQGPAQERRLGRGVG